MDLFLYGTLRYPPLFDLVAGPDAVGAARPLAARLHGHRVTRVAGDILPMLHAAEGHTVAGVLWTGLTPAQRTRLDLYESPFGYLPGAVTVDVDGQGPRPALAYFPPADQVSDGTDWQLAGWERLGAETACLAAAELALIAPPLTGAALRRQWKMIRMRAHVQARAAATRVPATLRRAAAPGDIAFTHDRPLAGDFFRMAAMTVDHLRFDGGRAEGLAREVLVGGDAALVLPYDPVRDRVLLIEQVRTGPMRRHDPNPWCLEPVAGIVDAGETPAEAALREAVEEAGLHLAAVEPMFAVYASPGSTTDHFYCFAALADLPDDHATSGGLEEEAEDIRLHLVDFADAMALIDSGEANVAPLVAMLYWLATHRDRLRATVPGSHPAP